MTERVLVCVFDLIASSDFESEILSVSTPISKMNCGVPQSHSFSEKRSASGTLLCEESQRARASRGRQ